MHGLNGLRQAPARFVFMVSSGISWVRSKYFGLQTVFSKFLVYFIAIFALLLSFLSQADSSLVTYQDGRLTVAFVNSRLAEAMGSITRETGIRFSIPASLEGSIVNERFTGLPLTVAIERLLGGYNYIISYAHSSSDKSPLERVIILDRSRQHAVSSNEDYESVLNVQQPQLEVTLNRQPSGHYVAAGMINDYPVEFLIDTGATLVTIPGELADRASLVYGSAKSVNTANGRGQGYITTLQSVTLDNIVLRQVKAIILPNAGDMKQVLLGMSFLEAFELVQKNDALTIRHPR
jgi:aspartyl protease family protein